MIHDDGFAGNVQTDGTWIAFSSVDVTFLQRKYFWQGDFLARLLALFLSFLYIKPTDFTHDIPAFNTTCKKAAG